MRGFPTRRAQFNEFIKQWYQNYYGNPDQFHNSLKDKGMFRSAGDAGAVKKCMAAHSGKDISDAMNFGKHDPHLPKSFMYTLFEASREEGQSLFESVAPQAKSLRDFLLNKLDKSTMTGLDEADKELGGTGSEEAKQKSHESNGKRERIMAQVLADNPETEKELNDFVDLLTRDKQLLFLFKSIYQVQLNNKLTEMPYSKIATAFQSLFQAIGIAVDPILKANNVQSTQDLMKKDNPARKQEERVSELFLHALFKNDNFIAAIGNNSLFEDITNIDLLNFKETCKASLQGCIDATNHAPKVKPGDKEGNAKRAGRTQMLKDHMACIEEATSFEQIYHMLDNIDRWNNCETYGKSRTITTTLNGATVTDNVVNWVRSKGTASHKENLLAVAADLHKAHPDEEKPLAERAAQVDAAPVPAVTRASALGIVISAERHEQMDKQARSQPTKPTTTTRNNHSRSSSTSS